MRVLIFWLLAPSVFLLIGAWAVFVGLWLGDAVVLGRLP